MTFGAFQPARPQAMMSDINVTPMVDVMLVLLVIFIMTAPLLTHKMRLALPTAGMVATPAQAHSIIIAIDAAGIVYLDGAAVTPAQLDAQLALAAATTPQPELQLMADKNTRYDTVAKVMSTAQMRGLGKLSFVTQANKENEHGQR
ncbi:biopolymer transporter ExbD [Massilia sp. PAMC28688]|uniref:ExbD/TolR family protein n=1 Tax=Massilia sp. PAMC28688 TaxID=2861283 RepID=UPI001C637E7E|nr:biopolymer transporter ExbD [Massilia sp. PAMC28688]QYF95559.1 biopolymer transporter ExbD [Massilia sp. PAMC28688]